MVLRDHKNNGLAIKDIFKYIYQVIPKRFNTKIGLNFITMEEVLKSTLLEYEKSTFLIDIIKHHSGEAYINFQQTIVGIETKQELKINLSLLSDIISILQIYQKAVGYLHSTNNKSYFDAEKQRLIVERYLKGISITSLVLQFDCSSQIIEQILFNKGIDIIDQNPSNRKRRFKKSGKI